MNPPGDQFSERDYFDENGDPFVSYEEFSAWLFKQPIELQARYFAAFESEKDL